MEMSSFSVDLRGPAADCMDCLVALPVAVGRMRDATNDTDIPNSMIRRTLEAFIALESRPRKIPLWSRREHKTCSFRTHRRAGNAIGTRCLHRARQ